MILYQLVSGRLPFHGDSITELAVKVVIDPPEPLAIDAPRFAAIVYRCLEKAADDRYQTVAALAADLAPLGGGDAGRSAALVATVSRERPVLATAPPSPTGRGVATTLHTVPPSSRGASSSASVGAATPPSRGAPSSADAGAATPPSRGAPSSRPPPAYLWLPIAVGLGLPARVAWCAALPAPIAAWRIARLAEHRDPAAYERLTFCAVLLLIATSLAEVIAFATLWAGAPDR